MKIAVLGGKLQGLEVIYLAKEAGYETLLIDKAVNTPAQDVCDDFLHYAFTRNCSGPAIKSTFPDILLPACEDLDALKAAEKWAIQHDIPFALDLNAFRISCSKIASNKIFSDLGLPVPKSWPECGFPIVIKPDGESGSAGVCIINNKEELSHQYEEVESQIIQEYLEGPSYSIEVIGKPGNYLPLQVTELFMDEVYDCCQVAASVFPESLKLKLQEMIIQIAEKISLHGIMDLEVIEHGNQLKILEIDARFPSQTPIAVYHSTGFNMVKMLVDLFMDKPVLKEPNQNLQYTLLQHVQYNQGELTVKGEHIMADKGPLQHKKDFLGADTTLTNHSKESDNWVGTFIFTSPSNSQLQAKIQHCHSQLRKIQSS